MARKSGSFETQFGSDGHHSLTARVYQEAPMIDLQFVCKSGPKRHRSELDSLDDALRAYPQHQWTRAWNGEI